VIEMEMKKKTDAENKILSLKKQVNELKRNSNS